jgi:hypothetical protein
MQTSTHQADTGCNASDEGGELVDGGVADRVAACREDEQTRRQATSAGEWPVAALGLTDREHRPSGAEMDHLPDHLGLVALGGDLERCSEACERRSDDGSGVRSGREEHPRTPRGRFADRDARRAIHGEFLDEQALDVDAAHRGRGSDADDEVEFSGDEEFGERPRRRNAQAQVDVGTLGPECPEDLGVVSDRGRVDHSDPDASTTAVAHPCRPVGEVVGQAEHEAGVRNGGFGIGSDPPTSTVAFEQGDPDPTFEFGKALGERRRAHAHPVRSIRPRRGLVDRDQVFELADRQVGQRAHPAQDTSELLHSDTVV